MENQAKPLTSRCEEIANFYFPTAPNPIGEKHEFCKKHDVKPGAASRTWFLEGEIATNADDFASSLADQLFENVEGPIDILFGHAQGGFAINALLSTANMPPQLHDVRAVVIALAAGFPARLPPRRLQSLHIIGMMNRRINEDGAEMCAKMFDVPIVCPFPYIDHRMPFKRECWEHTLEFIRGIRDFHGAFPTLGEMESELESEWKSTWSLVNNKEAEYKLKW